MDVKTYVYTETYNKLEIAQMPIQKVVFPNNLIIFSSKKEQTSDTHNNLDKFRHYAE